MFLGFLSLVFVLPLLFCFAASHVLLEGPANGSTYGRPGALDIPPLVRVRARRSPSEGGGLVPSCSGISLLYFVWQRVTGTLGRTASRAFCWGGGVFVCPLRPFFTRTFLSPPHVFFLAFGACACLGEPEATLEHAWNDEFRELLREFPEELRDS